MRLSARVVLAISLAALVGCAHDSKPKTGEKLARTGDEIVICGQFFHTGAPVVTWMDPGGYDAYRTERRFAPWDVSDFASTLAQTNYDKEHHVKNPIDVTEPNRYNVRFDPSTTKPAIGGPPLTAEEFAQVRGGGWTLPMIQARVDQFVYHYDVDASSKTCFRVLHDMRDLSVHFMLDVDGTIYQTLDVKERAWQATIANSRSVGIEIANIGAYPADSPNGNATLAQYYRKEPGGQTRIVMGVLGPAAGVRTPNFIAHPLRNDAIIGEVQHKEYKMYDLTPQQYDSLIKLTATLCTVLPKMKCDYPRDEHGKLITHQLSDSQYASYQGLLGHYHVQDNKEDPGPAFQWDRVINGARKLMGLKPLPPGDPYASQSAPWTSPKK